MDDFLSLYISYIICVTEKRKRNGKMVFRYIISSHVYTYDDVGEKVIHTRMKF